MCTLLLWKNRHPVYPIIIAANRDEFEERPSTEPQRLHDRPLVVGGRDEVAGGTWLAVNETGTLVALTNRRGAGRHDPRKRSRGLLVRELAQLATPAGIAASLRELDPHAYNPFVFIAVDRSAGIAAHAGDDGLRIEPILDGVHAVTNWEMDERRHPKTRHALDIARALRLEREREPLAAQLHHALADHAPGEHGNDGGLCVHRPAEQYGTVSSAIVLLDAGGQANFYYARGHACESRISDASALLRTEDSASARVER
ncbi:MAG: NRDE family protein [Candidatus Eremiobacteraeota bacterium]|nr:NRDE family protein [Candidatus Eremiobacteraeota bacterium]